MGNSKYLSPLYYTEKKPIGFLSLIKTVYQSLSFENDSKLRTCLGVAYVDFISVFIIARRVFESMKKDNIEISLDATSYYFFLRIYYDTISSAVHFLSKCLMNNSRTYIPIGSFNDQLEWLKTTEIREWRNLYNGYIEYGYKDEFIRIRDIRNQVKMRPFIKDSRRFIIEKMDIEPKKTELRKNMGSSLFKTISLTDYLGDYFFKNIPKLREEARIDYDSKGYPVGYLHPGERAIYEWFITDSERLNLKNYSLREKKWIIEYKK